MCEPSRTRLGELVSLQSRERTGADLRLPTAHYPIASFRLKLGEEVESPSALVNELACGEEDSGASHEGEDQDVDP
jgi:hypothetical protein